MPKKEFKDCQYCGETNFAVEGQERKIGFVCNGCLNKIPTL